MFAPGCHIRQNPLSCANLSAGPKKSVGAESSVSYMTVRGGAPPSPTPEARVGGPAIYWQKRRA
eukprot:7599024-Pyramimonas_sp.AAC.1